MNQQCCNPFGGYHGFCKVFDVSERIVESAKKHGINITTSHKICKPCRKKIENPPASSASSSSHQPQRAASTEMGDVEMIDVDLDATIGPPSSSESKEETDLDDQFEPANIDAEKLKEATNNLLTLLGIGAIDYSKMRTQKFQIEVMKKLTNRLSKAWQKR